MGGQWGYAGLWINDTFGSGHSKAGPKCTTYNSPQLSSTAEFSFDVMEVWAVGRKQSGQEEEEEKVFRQSFMPSTYTFQHQLSE